MKKLTFYLVLVFALVFVFGACSDELSKEQIEKRWEEREALKEKYGSDFFFFADEYVDLTDWITDNTILTPSMDSSVSIDWKYITPNTGSYMGKMFRMEVIDSFYGVKRKTFKLEPNKIFFNYDDVRKAPSSVIRINKWLAESKEWDHLVVINENLMVTKFFDKKDPGKVLLTFGRVPDKESVFNALEKNKGTLGKKILELNRWLKRSEKFRDWKIAPEGFKNHGHTIINAEGRAVITTKNLNFRNKKSFIKFLELLESGEYKTELNKEEV